MKTKARHVLQIDVIHNGTPKTGEREGEGMTREKKQHFSMFSFIGLPEWRIPASLVTLIG